MGAMARTDSTLVLPMLTVAGGCLDVTAFTHLGGAFASVMTSNLVFIAVAAATTDATLAAHSAAALAGFVVGVAAGSALVPPSGTQDRLGTRPLSVLLALECVLLAGVAAGWIGLGARPAGWQQVVLLAVAALAMGLQSAAARALGNPRAGTTYLTGTLTGIVSAIATGRRPDAVAVLCLCGLLVGAGIAAALLEGAPDATAVPPAVALVCVFALSWRRGHERADGGQPRSA
jgi:uncharacterized membrane protein YoaK (UPF0700 family)